VGSFLARLRPPPGTHLNSPLMSNQHANINATY